MADEVEFLWKTIESFFKEQNERHFKWNDTRDIFERLKMLARDPDYRNQISSSNINQTQQVLVSCENLLSSSVTGEVDETLVSCLKAATEAFRFLRNSSAGVSQNQECIVKTGVIQLVMRITHKLLKPYFQESNDRDVVNDTIKSAIQLLGNVVVGNSTTQEYTWKECFPDFFLSVMTSSSLQIQNCLCMVIYNCMSPTQRDDLVSSCLGLKIMSQILHLCSDHEDLEWGYFIIDSLVKNGHVGDLYTGLEFDPSARIIMLDLIQAHLSGSNSDSSKQEPLSTSPTKAHCSLSEESLVYFATEFERISEAAFFHKEYDYSTAENMLDALLISRLLSLLSKATALHLPALQSQVQLLHKALDLLHQTNEPANRDRFSSLSSKGQAQDSGKLSPSHGFKRDLVRLIGNMCYQHKLNQDEVRIREGIPLLLDHCNVDDHNPYICQWAVFAIRNILENNIENQNIVSSLDKQGLADNSRVRHFGVDVKETDDGQIKIVPNKKS